LSLSNGKIVWAKNLELCFANLKELNVNDESIKDGEKIFPSVKELGMSDIYPMVLELTKKSNCVRR